MPASSGTIASAAPRRTPRPVRGAPLLPLLLLAGAVAGAEHAPPTLAELAGRSAAAAPPAAHAEPAAHAGPAATAAPAAAGHAAGPPPLTALARLTAGNARFVSGHRAATAEPAGDAAVRAATAGGQHPFAAVLTCADSRVPPELIFDQTLGELFVVRNAGNVAEPVGAGSLEYAIGHLGVRLIVVLGHGSCGAVKAVAGADAALPGQLAAVQRAMPGLHAFAEERSRAGLPAPAVIAAAVERNAAEQAAALLAASPDLRERAADGRIAVVPAVYDLASGAVGFLTPVGAAAPARTH